MKLLACMTTLAGFANAGLSQMKADMDNVVNRYVRGVMQNPGAALDRNIPEILGSNIENINEYGCWCYFQNDHGRGHGKPMDGLDRMCRKLHMGYDCAIMDVIDATGNDTCIPWETFYISGTGGGEAGLVATCEAVNSDQCATAACKVEGIFVLKVFNLFVSGDSLDESLKHANGFDAKIECPVPGCEDDPDRCDPTRLCCGEYPDRFPYKPMGGDRGCCGGVAFDASILTCCPDDAPRLSC